MTALRTLLWALGGGVAGLLSLRLVGDRRAARLERALLDAPVPDPLDDDAVARLPAPAQRYLRHALAEAPHPAAASHLRSVRLWMRGEMVPSPGANRLRLTAEEVLAPPYGFVWTARARMSGLPVRVRDHYARGEGGVRVTLLGLLPLPSGGGADVARSSRGRLAGEAVWCPATLLPGPGVTWEAVDDDRARVTVTIDGEPIPLTLRVDAEGRLREITLARWGDVGVPAWQPIPYGFAVEAEGRFDGVAIPTRIVGGWWYGTTRYDPDAAATFTVEAARFTARR